MSYTRIVLISTARVYSQTHLVGWSQRNHHPTCSDVVIWHLSQWME